MKALKLEALFWEYVHLGGRGFTAFIRFSKASRKEKKEKEPSIELMPQGVYSYG